MEIEIADVLLSIHLSYNVPGDFENTNTNSIMQESKIFTPQKVNVDISSRDS